MATAHARPQDDLVSSADAAFAAQDWQAAADAYRRLALDQPDEARTWFRLGQSLHALEQLDAAIEAYEKVLDTGDRGPLAGRAVYHMARALAVQGQDGRALDLLDELAARGSNAPVASALSTADEFASLRDNSRYEGILQRLTPCGTAEYRQFDFWLGDWEVYAGNGQLAGTNRITRALNGCTLHESWESASGGRGNSYNFYDAANDKWHQTWIDANGAPLYVDGGLQDGKMVLGDGTNRITWTPLPNGYVRQYWETTGDGGQTWSTAFDGEYRPASISEPEVSYDTATNGTRWLEGRDGGLAIKVLVEAANLGGTEVELAEITFPAGSRGAGHVHGAVEIFYVLSGALEHTVNGETTLLEPGMVGIVRPPDEVTHSVPGDEDCRALVIWAPGGEAERIARFFRQRPVS